MLPIISTYDALEALYRGDKITSSWLVESCFERDKYNRLHEVITYHYDADGNITSDTTKILKDPHNINIEDLILNGLDKWFIPEEYINIDIREHLMLLCSREHIERVEKELRLYEERDLFNVLRFLIYFVDHMRKNNLVWGVGRGSSVSSYVLYLIGVHKIDSIEYSLEIEEFLR